MDAGGEWVHYGLTSSDVLDTAGGVIMAEAGGDPGRKDRRPCSQS